MQKYATIQTITSCNDFSTDQYTCPAAHELNVKKEMFKQSLRQNF